jgi:hypothetical protein
VIFIASEHSKSSEGALAGAVADDNAQDVTVMNLEAHILEGLEFFGLTNSERLSAASGPKCLSRKITEPVPTWLFID